MRLILALLVASTISAAAAKNADPLLPDITKTPGSANPALNQARICDSAFSTKPFRRPSKSKRACVLSRYGKPSYVFTYDHLVPLELGGLDGCDNLWPEPRSEAKRKDQVEDALRAHVCVCHDITLPVAQDMIRQNWLTAFAKYVTPKHTPMCKRTDPGKTSDSSTLRRPAARPKLRWSGEGEQFRLRDADLRHEAPQLSSTRSQRERADSILAGGSTVPMVASKIGLSRQTGSNSRLLG